MLDDLVENRSDMLVVMSFCLLGEITFISPNLTDIGGHPCTTILMTLSLAAWATAFLIGVFTRKSTRGVYAVPGGNERIEFLANEADNKKFLESDTKPYDADEFLSLEYLRRINAKIPANPSYKEVIDAYNDYTADDTSLESFNRNAWLGFLVQLTASAKKKSIEVEKRFTAIYICFSA